VGPWVKGGGEHEAQPLQVGLWIEGLILQLHREGARRLIAPGGPPVDQFSFWNGEGDVDWRGLPLERREGLPKEVNVCSVGGRGHCDSKVVDVEDDKRPGDFQVKGGDVYDEPEGGDGRALRDSDREGGEMARGPLESQAAGAVSEERADPLDQVWADPLSVEESEE